MNKRIKQENTHEFIRRSQQTNSYKIDNRSTTPRFPPNIRTTDALKSAIKKEHPELTGVIEPALPMTISVPDFDGHRLRVTLLINPNNMNQGRTNTVTTAYTRKGWITQAWGPNQGAINANGRTVAFMADGVGMTTFFRRQSFGYLNFMALMNAYKNNGYRMLDPTKPRLKDDTRVPYIIYGVEITYDNQIFTGHFANFTLDENAEHPFLFDYNFEFIISTNSDDFNEIRGHFNKLKPEKDYRTNFSRYNKPGDIESERTGYTSTTTSQIKTLGPETPLTKMKPRPDEELIRLWKEKTGFEFDVAIEIGATDNSVRNNLSLKADLLEGKYNAIAR